MFARLDSLKDPEELRALTARNMHALTGGRKGALEPERRRKRRLTFCIDPAESEICDLNLEDYH